MKRREIEGKTYLTGYHTQEHRHADQPLEAPIICKDKNAWLGVGYYFWTEKEFAHYWGQDFKMKTDSFDIYRAYLNVDNCIDAVFSEEGYFFFRRKIEETIKYFSDEGLTISLDAVHRFLAKNIWPKLGIDGVIYDDKPHNPSRSDRIYSEVPDLYYKKRIQVGLFDLKNIINFELLEEDITE